jgi:hypothetical protein
MRRSARWCSASPPTPVAKVKKFHDKYDLDFPLLADEGHAVADAYGVWAEKSMYGKTYFGNERTTFIVDPDGKVAQIAAQGQAGRARRAGAGGSAQASTLPTLTLALTKTSITVGGTPQSGAVNVVSTDSGVKEGATILFALKPGYTVAEVEAALKAGAGMEPNLASKYGAIVFDAEVNPGQTSEAQTILRARPVRCARRYGRRRAETESALHCDSRRIAGRVAHARRPRSARSSSASAGRARCTTASSCASKTKASSCTWTWRSPQERERPPSRSSRIC